MNNNFIASPLLGAKQLAVSWITLLLCFCSPLVVAKDVLNVGFIERAPSIYQTASGDMRGVLGKRIAQILKEAKMAMLFQRITLVYKLHQNSLYLCVFNSFTPVVLSF